MNNIQMIIAKDMNDAVAMHDANPATSSPFYSSFENVRAEHERFFEAYPNMGSQWLYCPQDNTVYSVASFKGQRIISKHTLHTSISNGTLAGVAAEDDGETITFRPIVEGISKQDDKSRRQWCKRSDQYLF